MQEKSVDSSHKMVTTLRVVQQGNRCWIPCKGDTLLGTGSHTDSCLTCRRASSPEEERPESEASPLFSTSNGFINARTSASTYSYVFTKFPLRITGTGFHFLTGKVTIAFIRTNGNVITNDTISPT